MWKARRNGPLLQTERLGLFSRPTMAQCCAPSTASKETTPWTWMCCWIRGILPSEQQQTLWSRREQWRWSPWLIVIKGCVNSLMIAKFLHLRDAFVTVLNLYIMLFICIIQYAQCTLLSEWDISHQLSTPVYDNVTSSMKFSSINSEGNVRHLMKCIC